MAILGINGIRSDGAQQTDKLLAKLVDYETIDTAYPLTSILRARPHYFKQSDAKLLIQKYYQEGDHVVAHSRGCLVNHEMMVQGAKFDTVFWFRPAMNIDFLIPPEGCKRLYVIYSPDDRAIWWGSKLWWHDFGNAGRLGLEVGDYYLADGTINPDYDKRVVNYIAPKYDTTEFWRHSDDFLDENINIWVKFINWVLSE